MINQLFYGKVKKIHFIGIGGIGMSGIALVLRNLGFEIQGSDIACSATTDFLKENDIDIFIGHKAENIKNADLIVASAAIHKENPEIISALKNHIPVIPRSEMLAEIMRFKYGIAIAGAHGKTTSTSLTAHLLREANLSPTVVIGGKVNQQNANAWLGTGQFMVAEADESDGSFVHLSPSIIVLTNIDWEHLDYWEGGITQIKEHFIDFINKLPFYGLLIANKTCPHIADILPHIKRRVITYGIDESCDFWAKDIVYNGFMSSFDIMHRNKNLGRTNLSLVGQHNVENSLTTFAIADELRIPSEIVQNSLANFKGVERRFSFVGAVNNIYVIDDYGHHPTEIKAVLKAAQEAFRNKRIITLFQPHRYSRTLHLLDDFAESFFATQKLFIADIYGAFEENDKFNNISSKDLVLKIKQSGHNDCEYISSIDNGVDHILKIAQPDDVIITLGAGNITQAAPKILSELKKNYEQ